MIVLEETVSSNLLQVHHLAARASCTFAVEALDEDDHKLFSDLIPGILQVYTFGKAKCHY